MAINTDPRLIDPKGLIRDSYRIDGISLPECRSIFLDWAISLPEDQEVKTLIRHFLDTRQASDPTHPMTTVLQEGLAETIAPIRRGGRASRFSST